MTPLANALTNDYRVAPHQMVGMAKTPCELSPCGCMAGAGVPGIVGWWLLCLPPATTLGPACLTGLII